MNLKDFMLWFMRRSLDQLFPIEVYNAGQAMTTVLYRDPPFQVELAVLRPGAGFPVEHRHPDIDSIEVSFCGNIPLTINGKPVRMRPLRRPSDVHRFMAPMYITRIKHTDWHGSDNIDLGGSFFSVQEWLHGVTPTSVLLNWEGKPISAEHGELLSDRSRRAA